MPDALLDRVRKAFLNDRIFTFQRMVMIELSPCEGKDESGVNFDYSGIIGFSGDITGNCVLPISEMMARETTARIIGESVVEPLEIADGVGELANMIAGNAKASLQDFNISLFLPEIIHGEGHEFGFHRYSDFFNLFCNYSGTQIAHSAHPEPGRRVSGIYLKLIFRQAQYERPINIDSDDLSSYSFFFTSKIGFIAIMVAYTAQNKIQSESMEKTPLE